MTKKTPEATPEKDKYYFPDAGVQVEGDDLADATKKLGELKEQEKKLDD